MRTPVSARSRANPATSAPGSGSSTHSTPSSPSSSTVRRAEAGSSAGSMSPGIRQAWLRSTMMSIESPTASRTARTVATPTARSSLTNRILSARNPCSRSASADSARADDVPEGRLEWPVAAGVEADGIQAPNVAGDLERIFTEEEPRVRLEAVHGVARAQSHQALVGLDANDRGVEARAGNRVPRGPERRIQRQPQALELDLCDLHDVSARSSA